MDYKKILEDLDMQLSVVEYEISEICDKNNFPLEENKKRELTDLYVRSEKLGNLFNKIVEQEDRASMAYFEDEDDYVESEDAYIPSIHNDQYSFNN